METELSLDETGKIMEGVSDAGASPQRSSNGRQKFQKIPEVFDRYAERNQAVNNKADHHNQRRNRKNMA